MSEPAFDPFNGLSTGEAQVLSAAALLVVTAVAATFAFRAVRESRLAREQGVRPFLALDLDFMSPMGHARVVILNAGQGAALDANLELAFRPHDETVAAPVRRLWRWPLLAPGQRYEFHLPKLDGAPATVPELAAVYPRITLTGTVRDQLGTTHPVDLEYPDLAQFWKRTGEAGQAWVTDPVPDALKDIEGALRAIDQRLAALVEHRPTGPRA